MEARRVTIKCLYDSQDISQDIAAFLKGFSITEVLGGQADEAEISLHDREELWMGDWLPELGSTMDITLQVSDWEGEGDTKELPFGKFDVDEISLSGAPNEAKIKLISIPQGQEGLNTVKKTRAWEKVKLSQIAKDVATGAEIELYYDTEEDPVLERAEQSEQTDLSFLQKLCKDAGLSLKVSDGKIVIFDVSKYEKAEPVLEIVKGDAALKSFECRQTIHDIYKACHVKYKHSKKDEFIEYTFKDPKREKGQTLEINEKVESVEEAEKLAKKKLHEKNLEEVSVSLTMLGNFALLASNTVTLKGFHSFDGKYIIKKSSHDVGSGYTTKVDLRRVIDGY